MNNVMAMVSKSGMMTPDMKDSGKMIKHMAKASSTTPVEIYLKENGKRTWPMALEGICTSMESFMKVIGRMISRMDLVEKYGWMAVCMKGSI